jgi:hypothetical protein
MLNLRLGFDTAQSVEKQQFFGSFLQKRTASYRLKPNCTAPNNRLLFRAAAKCWTTAERGG